RAAVLFLVAAVIVLTGSFAWVWREKGQKEAALEGEKQARAEEARRRQQTRQALDAMSAHVIDHLLAQQRALLPEVREFLRKALSSYEEFAEETGRDEATRVGIAKANYRIGTIREKVGELAAARATLLRARGLYAELVADFPTAAAYRECLATTHNTLGV